MRRVDIRLEDAVFEAIEEGARKEGRSVRNFIIRFLTLHFGTEDIDALLSRPFKPPESQIGLDVEYGTDEPRMAGEKDDPFD